MRLLTVMPSVGKNPQEFVPRPHPEIWEFLGILPQKVPKFEFSPFPKYPQTY